MGCFNHTCAVSNLPVECNDPVVVFILASNRFLTPGRMNNSLIYANHYYEPFGFPFVARYNDYGWVENEEKSAFLDWTLKKIDSNLIERPVGPNQYHDPAVERGRMTTEYLGELVWEDRLRLENPIARGVYIGEGEEPLLEYRATGYMFVHQHIYEELCQSFTEEYYDFDKKKYVRWSMASYVETLERVFSEIKADTSDIDRIIHNYRLQDKIDRYFPTAKNLLSIREEVSDIDQNDLFKRLSEIAAFDLCMSRLHKLYMPQRAGSQDGVPKKLFEALTRSMKTVIKEKHKRSEE